MTTKPINDIAKLKRIVSELGNQVSPETLKRIKEIEQNSKLAWMKRHDIYSD